MGIAMFTPRVYFITPVHQRFGLTRACLRQRRELIDSLPFPAQAVIVGDDANMDVARDLGFLTREMPNEYVSSKFNGGYATAIEDGATHVMGVGSDSFLHPEAFADADWQERRAVGLIGLSAMSPEGDERLDLSIKYPAGFGVGMVYPEWAIRHGRGADPYKNSGIDTSTWARCGRGKLMIDFLRMVPQSYTNFHSPDTQITSWKSLRGTHVARGRADSDDPWGPLVARYGPENVRRVQEVYAVHSLGVFLTGERPQLERAHRRSDRLDLPGRRGRPPARSLESKSLPRGAAKARHRESDRWGRVVPGYDYEGIFPAPLTGILEP
jgi:hypothetical protein